MSLKEWLKAAEKFTTDNSPAILTGIAVTGAVTTAVLTGKATYKAAYLLAEEQNLFRDDFAEVQPAKVLLEPKEKVKLVWHLYIPAVGAGVTTIAAMIAANQIGTRRTAALAVAYSVSENAFSDYRDKVVEKFGDGKATDIRDELAQDRVAKTPVSDTQVVMVSDHEVLCFDMHSGRYFHSSMETLKKAQNDLNYRILRESYASLNDFYEKVGLEILPSSEELGWTAERQLELIFSTVMSTDQRPCIAIDFSVAPFPNYYKGHWAP